MSFSTISTGFSRFVFNRDKNTFIFGTVQYIDTLGKTNINSDSVYIEDSTLSLTVDSIALSFLIFGKSLPDFIDLETKKKSLFGFIIYSILNESDEVIQKAIDILQTYFEIKFKPDARYLIDQIMPKALQKKCLWIVSQNLYNFVEIYLPIDTQEDLEFCLTEININFRKKTQELLASVIKESQSSTSTSLRSGRVRESRYLWSAYKLLLMRSEEEHEDYLAVIKELKSKAMSSDEPFFQLRNRVLSLYNNMNIEKYIRNQTLDLDNLILSVSTASTYRELWYYAVKMKGLIFEVISSIYLSHKYMTRIEYHSEPTKLPLSQILGDDLYQKLILVLSSDFQTVDPVPDFYEKNLNDTGDISVTVIEVGWWTDSQSKIVQEQEKWKPFLQAAEEQRIDLKLEIVVCSSRKMDQWPTQILSHKDSMKWVNASKSAFRILMLTPDEEEEIETSMLSSTEVRRLISLHSRVISPMTEVDFERKKTQVLNTIKKNMLSNYCSNDIITSDSPINFDSERVINIVNLLENSLNSQSQQLTRTEDDIQYVFDTIKEELEQIEGETSFKDEDMLTKLYTEEQVRVKILETFMNKESKLITESETFEPEQKIRGSRFAILNFAEKFKIKDNDDMVRTLMGPNYDPMSVLFQNLAQQDEFDMDTREENSSVIDTLLRLPMPGRTSRQKRMRKYFSIFYMRFLKFEGFDYFVDRVMRITSVRAAHQNIGGKIDEAKLQGYENTVVRNCEQQLIENVDFESIIKSILIRTESGVSSQSITKIVKHIIGYVDLNYDYELQFRGQISRLALTICNLVFLISKLFQEELLNNNSYSLNENGSYVLDPKKMFKGETLKEEFETDSDINLKLLNDNEVLANTIEVTLNLNWHNFIITGENSAVIVKSSRKKEVIERVYELLGHRSLEEQKEVLIERVSGKNYQRNSPSLVYDIDDVLNYNNIMLTNELSNFGVFCYNQQLKGVHKSLNDMFLDFYSEAKKTQNLKSIFIINLFFENFNTERMNFVQRKDYKIHLKNLENLILTLMMYETFITYCLLSTIARSHLSLNNKFNGLKEHSVPSINAKLYIMQPDKNNSSLTPSVLVINNYSYFRFNLDYIRSKLWLSMPYMICLCYGELLQEYGLYNQTIQLTTLYKYENSNLVQRQKYNSILKDGTKLVIEPNFDTVRINNYFNQLISVESENENVVVGSKLEDQVAEKRREMLQKIEDFEKGKISYIRDLQGLPNEELDISESEITKEAIFRTRSGSVDEASEIYNISSVINDRLVNGILNFLFWPAIYNNKYNNEFRQALRYLYAGIGSHYQNNNIGEKFSHITRYEELYMDKIIGLFSTHYKNIRKKYDSVDLEGPCWTGFLPIINNNVLTFCMFICHVFNKVISNYNESLLKTMDGTFEIPLQMFEEMKNANPVLDDLTFGTSETPLRERINYLLKNHSNKSYVIEEVLNIGVSLLRERLASSSFKDLEFAKGLHNNFMDIAEVTNCISVPKREITLTEMTRAVMNEKFNKVIKFASNRRNKLQDKSFIDTVIKIAEEQFQMIPQRVDLLKKYVTQRSAFNREYSVDFFTWSSDNDNESIINSMKILLKTVNSQVKDIEPQIFKKIKDAVWPDHIVILSNLYNKLNPDFSKRLKLDFDRLEEAEKELEALYINFNEVKEKLIKNDKYLSHIGVRSTLTTHEGVFRNSFKKELNDWLLFLLNCASLSPIAFLSIVKNPVIIHKLLNDDEVRRFNYNCFKFGPEKYPNLTRYVCGCIISKTRLDQTNFVAIQASLDEIGSVMRTFFHNSSGLSLYSEFCKLYILIAQGNWKTGQRLLHGWRERGLPRSTRNKVIFEALRTSNLYNSHNVAAVAFNIIKREDWSYFAGLAPKAQLGGLRDLLVQDFESKIVLHVSEQMALYCLECLPNDILGHPDAKDFALKRMNELLTNPETKNACVFICGDKKKWAQKHTTLFFYKLIDGLFRNNGCKQFLKMVMLEGLKKEIEIPVAFIEHYTKKLIKDSRFNGDETQSKLILQSFVNNPETKPYHRYLLNALIKNKSYIELFSHMGQGIHHKFSSLYGHAAELVSIEIAKKALKDKSIDVEIEYFRSSDDYTQLLLFKRNNQYVTGIREKTLLSKLYFKYYIHTMMMCNIRESEKSVVTSKFGEIYSTYASTEVIPAPFKFYIPNIMLSSAFTPLEIWRVKFAKMQQLYDNGMSLVGCFNFGVLENLQYQRFLPKNLFEKNDICLLPNTSISFIPHLSDVVFGTLSNSEIKILRDQVTYKTMNLSHIKLFTEFLQEIETRKSRVFFDLGSPQESILKEVYSLPFSRKFEKMQKMVDKSKEEVNLLNLTTENNLGDEIVNSENSRRIIINLLTRSSKTDSVVGEEIRFILALNSKGIIWGLSGGTREEAINMLRQVTSRNAFYNKRFSRLWKLVILNNNQEEHLKTKEGLHNFLIEIGSKIIKETIEFDKGFCNFNTRYFEINSVITPMKKVTHWSSVTKFRLTNQIEQVISYMINPKIFLEIRPRVKSSELLENDAQKIEAFIGIERSKLLTVGMTFSELMFKCIQLKNYSKGVRSSIIITHYDDDWKNIPKASLMYNTVHHWVIDSEYNLYYPMSSSEQLLEFCNEIMSSIAYFAGTEHCKRYVVTKLLSLPPESYPAEFDLKESLLTTLLKQVKFLEPNSKIKREYSTLISLLFDNLTDPMIEVHQEYQEKHTITELHTDNLGTFKIYTFLKEDGYCSLIMKNSLCVIKTDVDDSNLLQYILEIVRIIKEDSKLTINECLKYLFSNYNSELLTEVYNLYRKSKFTNKVEFTRCFIDTSIVIPESRDSNYTFLYSKRPILRSFSVKSKKYATQYLYIDALAWKKLQLTVKSSDIGEYAALIEDILTGKRVGKYQDLRIVTKQTNYQWVSSQTINFLIDNLESVNNLAQDKIGQMLKPKLRSSQILKTSGAFAETQKDWNLDDEDFLNQGGNYFFNSADYTIVSIEQSATLKNILNDTFSTLHRLERDRKIPSFMSPYIMLSSSFKTVSQYSKKLFSILDNDIYKTISLFINILKLIPQHLLTESTQIIHDKLLKHYNTFLYDLPAGTNGFKIEQLYSLITVKYEGNFKKFSQIVSPLLTNESMTISIDPIDEVYVLEIDMGIDEPEIIRSFENQLLFKFKGNAVSMADFVENLLTYSWNILNPNRLAVYGSTQEPPMFSQLYQCFEIKSNNTLRDVVKRERRDFLGKNYFKQLLGSEFESDQWGETSGVDLMTILQNASEDEDFYSGVA